MRRREPVEYRRGDVVWLNCDPSIGAEPCRIRTCVVISNDVANQHGQAVTVVPTQKYTADRADRAYMVDLRRPRSTLKEARVANASMITTYDRRRVVARGGKLEAGTMKELEVAVAIHLGVQEP